jgi:hypothetical protein
MPNSHSSRTYQQTQCLFNNLLLLCKHNISFKQFMKKYWIVLILSFLLFFGCSEQPKHDTHAEIIHEINNDKKSSTTEEVEDILSSIPKPKEITAMIKASGAHYSGLVVNSPMNIEKYSTNHRKAINLGIYGTDLGYIGIYDQTSIIPQHLKVINQLATEIDLAHLLRTEKLQNLLNEGNVTDSLFNVSSVVFEDMCKYLQTNERHETSVLMLLGGWLEAIHIATSVAYNAKIDNPNLNKKIADQKEVLNKFIEVLDLYKDQQIFKQILVDLTKLKKIYNKIEFKDSVVNMSDTATVQIPESSAMITDVQMAQIAIMLSKTRKSIINPQ